MSDWFKSTNESEAMLAEERLVLSATEAVYAAMDRAGVTKKGRRTCSMSDRLR
jgi:hypothetical protein